MLLSILISVLIVTIFTYYWVTLINANYWRNQNIVYVKKTNPFGLMLNFVLDSRPLAVLYKNILEKYPGENHVGVFQGWRAVLLIKEPENIQAVLAGDFNSFHSRGIFFNPKDKLADNVLFTNDYPRWKLTRQKLSPLFTSSKLKNMFYIVEHCAKDFMDYVAVKKDIEDKPYKIISTYTTASIAASVFGIDTNMKNSMESPFVKMISTAPAFNIRRKLLSLISDFWPQLVNILNIKVFGAFEFFFIGAVKKVLRERENEKVKRHDFIDMCIELQNNGIMRDLTTNYELEPTDEYLAGQAFFFFLAGADTTATTMNFTLFELSRNHHILEKLHKEIDEVFLKCVGKLTYEEVDKMQYLDMVLSESMRKYPAIGFLQRLCTRDTVLPKSQIKMKKNTVSIIPVFALHRDPNYFPNPDKYDPERFSPENKEKIVKNTYFPFGEGNRICLGFRLARIQMKTCIAYLLRRYTLLPVDHEIKLEPSAFAIRDENLTYKLIDR